MRNLSRLKEIWSHALPGATMAEVVKRALQEAVEANDPDLKAVRALERKTRKEADMKTQESSAPELTEVSDSQREVTTISESNRRDYIPAAVRHFVWFRDGGKCTFVNEQTGECCESRKHIQFDHIVAFGKGGESTVENLRLRCRAHNHRHAIDTYGFARANKWRSQSLIRANHAAYG